MTEDQLEQETLGWLAETGYAVHSGYDIAHDGNNPQRANYRQVVLSFRLRECCRRPKTEPLGMRLKIGDVAQIWIGADSRNRIPVAARPV